MQAEDALKPTVCWCSGFYLRSGTPCLPHSSHVLPSFEQGLWKFEVSADVEPHTWVWMRPQASTQHHLACVPSREFTIAHESSLALFCSITWMVFILRWVTQWSHPNNHPWERKSLCSALLYSFPITSQVSQVMNVKTDTIWLSDTRSEQLSHKLSCTQKWLAGKLSPDGTGELA